MTVRLALALVAMAPLQFIGLMRALDGPIAHGPASEQAIATAAPAAPSESLLLTDLPAGFASAGPVQHLGVNELTSHAADTAAATKDLEAIGYLHTVGATWVNAGMHQFVIVAVSEFKTPAGASARKSGVARNWTNASRTRIPITGITGIIASEYHPAQQPGKYPQAGYSAEFRVERWEFNVIAGTNVGPAGAVLTTPAFFQDVINRQIAAVHTHLAAYFPPALTADALVLRDRYCRCQLTAPTTWEPQPLDADLSASVIDSRGLSPATALSKQQLADGVRKHTPPVIFSASDTATDGHTLFGLFRAKRTVGAHAVADQAAAPAGNHPYAVRTLHLPFGTAYQFGHKPYTAGLGDDAFETLTAFDHAGWTYIAVELAVHPQNEQKTLDAILASLRLDVPPASR